MSTEPIAAKQEQDAAVSQPASYDDVTIKAREHTASIPAHSKSQYRRLTAQGADALPPNAQSAQSDTPRTDDLLLYSSRGLRHSSGDDCWSLARQLERELTAERQNHDATELRLEQTVANLVHEREARITADKVAAEFQATAPAA